LLGEGQPADGAGGALASGDWDWSDARSRCLTEAHRVLRSRSEAEDAVQEAMLRAWRKRGSCNGDSPLAWMLRITRNEALRLRAKPVRQVEPLADDAPLVAEDTRLQTAAERVDVKRAVAALEVEDQALLRLRYGCDLTQGEVARILDMPEGTAAVRLHRLRGRLKAALGASYG
jgi:RNA polymerase sigma-70 factor, ECF subfamily